MITFRTLALSVVVTLSMTAMQSIFAEESNTLTKETNMPSTSKKNPIVLLKTSMGNMKVELYPEKAPITVKNFLSYVNDGHYTDTIFHRVIPGFMIQGGGFTKEMVQLPVNAPIKNEADNGLKNDKGTLSMARTNDINSATAQFFINGANNDFLNYKSPSSYGYAVFGKVIEGTEVIDKIIKVRTGFKDGHQDVPVEPVMILSATVEQ